MLVILSKDSLLPDGQRSQDCGPVFLKKNIVR
jgi:hypothetical protein